MSWFPLDFDVVAGVDVVVALMDLRRIRWKREEKNRNLKSEWTTTKRKKRAEQNIISNVKVLCVLWVKYRLHRTCVCVCVCCVFIFWTRLNMSYGTRYSYSFAPIYVSCYFTFTWMTKATAPMTMKECLTFSLLRSPSSMYLALHVVCVNVFVKCTHTHTHMCIYVTTIYFIDSSIYVT